MLKKLFSKLMGSKKAKKRKSAPRPKRPKNRPRPRVKKQRKPAASKKPPLPPGAKEEIGRVVAFFRIPVVAVVKVSRGSIKLGDRIWIRGHTTDLKETVASMQINHQPIQEARKGDEAGVKVSARARRGDRVYRL